MRKILTLAALMFAGTAQAQVQRLDPQDLLAGLRANTARVEQQNRFNEQQYLLQEQNRQLRQIQNNQQLMLQNQARTPNLPTQVCPYANTVFSAYMPSC